MPAIALAAIVFAGCSGKEEKPSARRNEPVRKAITAVEPCDTDFDNFFEKFKTDSMFQRKHVKLPLKNTFLNSDGNYEVIREDITILKYRFLDFTGDEEAGTLEGGAFTVNTEQHKDSVFYMVRGIDNGIHTDIKFAYIDACWYLVAIEDSST